MHPVIIFDGYCRLCHWSVQFMLRHDHKRLFRFTTLDSNFAKCLPDEVSVNCKNDSVLLWHDGALLAESDAVLQMLTLLGGWWKLGAIGYAVPRVIRNAVYRLIARNRYKVFGQLESCPLPSPETAELFLP